MTSGRASRAGGLAIAQRADGLETVGPFATLAAIIAGSVLAGRVEAHEGQVEALEGGLLGRYVESGG